MALMRPTCGGCDGRVMCWASGDGTRHPEDYGHHALCGIADGFFLACQEPLPPSALT